MSLANPVLSLPPPEALEFLFAIQGALSIGLRNDQTREWRIVTASRDPARRADALAVAHRVVTYAGAGWSVHVRPLPNTAGTVQAVCLDLDAVPPDRLTALGLTPAAVVETSPGRFQAWLHLPTPLQVRDPDARGHVPGSVLMTGLIAATGADPGGRQATHPGRVPGYPNRKPEHPDARCRLISATGAVADPAALNRLYAAAYQAAERDRRAAEKASARRRSRAPTPDRVWPAKTPEMFYASQPDHSAADMSYAVYARDRMRLGEAEIAAEIVRARTAIGEIGWKGGPSGLRRYAQRTAAAACRQARFQRADDRDR